MSETRILGIDPGYANLGMVVYSIPKQRFLVGQNIRTKKMEEVAAFDLFRRCRELSGLIEFYYDYAPGDWLAVEGMSFPRNASSAVKLGASHGVIASLSAQWRMPNSDVWVASPQQVRKLVTNMKRPTEAHAHDAVLAEFPELAVMLNGVAKRDWPHILDAACVVVARLRALANGWR